MATKSSLDNYTIPDIEKVVEPFLDGRKVTKVNLSRLSAPGENYISLVFRVDFEVVDLHGKKETISAVAKRVPVSQPNNQAPFNLHEVAMRHEIMWYRVAVPLIRNFAKEYGVDAEYFATELGSRLSLDPESQKADSEALLLVKNLLPEGYVNEERHLGFDLKTAKSILKSLAAFHGTVLGMKFKKPEQFQIIKNLLADLAPKVTHDGPPEGLVLEKTIELPACQPYRSQLENLKNIAVPSKERFLGGGGIEPWTTVAHQDFWGNNIMVAKPLGDGDSPAVKFLDFQVCQYTSYAKDVAFFLLTSLRDEVMKQNFDELLKFYYDQLISVLQTINVPELRLSYDEFLAEMKRVTSKYEVTHALFFCNIAFASRDNVTDHLAGKVNMFEKIKNMINNMGERQKERLTLVVETCVKRGWF